jgi:hypothetical protein
MRAAPRPCERNAFVLEEVSDEVSESASECVFVAVGGEFFELSRFRRTCGASSAIDPVVKTRLQHAAFLRFACILGLFLLAIAPIMGSSLSSTSWTLEAMVKHMDEQAGKAASDGAMQSFLDVRCRIAASVRQMI